MQLIINILLSGLLVSLIANSLKIFFLPTRFFNVAFAAIVTLSAYLFYAFWQVMLFNIVISVILPVLLCCMLCVVIERFLFCPFRNRTNSSMVLMMVSLGIYIVIQNVIPIIWGNSTRIIVPGKIVAGHPVGGGYITNVQILCVLVCGSLMAISSLIMKCTKVGLSIRAVSDNGNLSMVQGVSSDRTILYATTMSTVLASLAGILLALEFSINPTMGFNWLLYGMVALIIGGTAKEVGVIAGGFLLATFQQFVIYYLGSQWIDFVVYVLLIVFLAIRPLGLYGVKIKKVEI